MIITDGTITIPTIPIMATAGAVSAGVLAWDLEWDGAWVCPSDTDIPIMDMEDTLATATPIMDMEDTMATATLITEVPTGADITMDTTMGIITDIMGTDITPKAITATVEWITDNMPVIPGLQEPL